MTGDLTQLRALLGDRLEGRGARALATAISNAVGEGLLPPESRLPPIRSVATELGVSATTVASAWEMLSRAGVIRSEGRRGTCVCAPRATGPSRYRRALRSVSPLGLDLSSGLPDPSLLPTLGPAWSPARPSSSSYLDDSIVPELRVALESGWPYRAPDITIVDGAMDGIDQTLALLVRVGDTVLVEHPTFPPFLDLLEAIGARVVGVPLDDEGLVVEELTSVLGGARLLLWQPRGHNPTGVATSPRRARALAQALRGWDGWVLEDDSVGPVSQVAPLSLGTWLPESTIHIRSFSKSMGPEVRLAALSGPTDFVTRLSERRQLGQGWSSRLLQSLLARLLTRPASLTQVSRARDHYGERRAHLVAELRALGVEVMGNDGLNLWLPVRDETAAVLLLASRGISVAAGSPFASRSDGGAHVRVTVALVREGVADLARHLRDAALAGPNWGPR